MKVALVAEWMDPWRGGAETSTQQFIHHLLDRGVELHIFTRSRFSSTPFMQIHTISGASMSRTRRSMTFAHRVQRLLRNGSFDTIHAISPIKGADIYQPRGGTAAETIERNLALRKTLAGRSLKRCANVFNFKQRYLLTMEREILGNDDGPVVVAISEYVVRQLKKHHGLPDERIRLIYNGVNPDESTEAEKAHDRATIREEYKIAEHDILVLLVAHNFRLKGVARWMEALSMLLKRGIGNVRCALIGKGESRHWHHLAAQLGIRQRISFVGPSDRVGAFHHAGDVLVHPTYYDPCSRVVLEAMSAGLPCITTRWDGAAEMIEDGVSGYVIDDPWDVSALAERIERLRQPDIRQAIGTSAKQVSRRIGMERHADEMLALYEESSSTAATQSTR
ncbi:MAG: glycosyltransferase family 4 protein [Phycisphaerales bacterium]|nr:MAG: glycosyltransferase family 4 protein [Phycisphaerales bacterium]